MFEKVLDLPITKCDAPISMKLNECNYIMELN